VHQPNAKEAGASPTQEGATIHDVARLANVSASTVSNWLKGRHERMRPETRDRIGSVVRQLGYRPNQVARQLKTGQVKTLGLIVGSVANPFWGMFAHRVEDAARKRGYQVLLGNSERDRGREQGYTEMLWASGVRGLIIGSSSFSFDHLSSLAERGMNIVAFDRPTQATDTFAFDSVGVDGVVGGRVATEHLLALGHRRIGFISGPLKTVSRLARLEGYTRALRDGGAHAPLVWEGAPTSGSFGDFEGAELGRLAARELLAAADPPTALFALNDMYALGAYAGVRDMGRRVPDDVSIVGFDDIFLADIVQPRLTTIRQPLAEMMERVVELVIGRIEGTNTSAPEHVETEVELIVRESTAPARTDGSSVT